MTKKQKKLPISNQDKDVIEFDDDDENFYFKLMTKMINVYLTMRIICLNLKNNMKLQFSMTVLTLFHKILNNILSYHQTML